MKINTTPVNFGQKLPVKKTYQAMQKYYESINDVPKAKEFKALDNQAKARLHNSKSLEAQNKLFDLSEEICDEAVYGDSLLLNGTKFIKLTTKAIYEQALGFIHRIKS